MTYLNTEEIHAKVDEIYSEGCRRYPTYEQLVINHFNAGVRGVFGADEGASETAKIAFEYAREHYDYQSVEEERVAAEKNAADGYCSHGLTVQTCPCGCFEGDDDYDDSDYDYHIHEEE